jgi:hypothetical protein
VETKIKIRIIIILINKKTQNFSLIANENSETIIAANYNKSKLKTYAIILSLFI